MQIAKMFASLGFKVDTSGLTNFKRAIADARSELTNISRGAKTATNQFRSLRRETDKLSASMGKIRNAGGNQSVGASYRNLAGDVHRVNNALNSIATNRSRTTNAIGKINASVRAGVPHWDAYRRSIVQTRRTLANLNGDLNRLRANARIDVRIRNSGAGGAGGGNGGNGGAGGFGGGLLGAGGLRAFMSNIVPAMAVGSIGGAVGYGGVAMVKAAREQTSMESMILMISDSAAEYKSTVDYVNNESRRLGLNAADLGKSFAQVSMSAENLSGTQKKEMFTGFSEFMMSMGTNADDQKGIFRAFNQMFSNNRLLQEEINQLSDRGIPATLVYDAAMKAYGLDTVAQVKKLQEAGKLDPSKVLPIMAKTLQDKAHSTGAFDKMRESSMFKQNQFMSELRMNSKSIMDGGLDVMLGKVFASLTGIVIEVGNVARAVKEIVVILNDLKGKIDGVTGGNGLLIMSLSLLIFRWRAVWLGMRRAFIVLSNGGAATRVLGELFTGVLGRAIKGLILRFGGLVAVLYGVWKALNIVGEAAKQKELGNWTVFDTIALHAENAWLKVKILVAELKWLKTYMSSGAMLNSNFDDVKNAVGKRAGNGLDYLTEGIPLGDAFNGGRELGKNLRDYMLGNKNIVDSGAPFINNGNFSKSKPQDLVVNFFNKDGTLAGQQRLPVTMPQ